MIGSKARTRLKWIPVWNVKTAIEKAMDWYKIFYKFKKLQTLKNITQYVADAKEKDLEWIQD